MERQNQEAEYKNLLLVWQTRTLASFIAATVPVEQGKRNPLLEAAAEISLGPTAEKEPQEPTNKPGSYERLTAGFKER